VRMWDIEKGKECLKVDGGDDTIQSLSWNYDTSNFATSSKDKNVRIIDPRAGKTVHKFEGHDGAKGFKVTYMGNLDRMLSVGFSKTSDRTIKLWDLRNLNNFMTEIKIDTGAGFFTPYFDADTGVLFLCGKGDGGIKMFEVNEEAPYVHYLTEYSSNTPAQGMALLPKTSCNVRDCEIASWLKLCSNFVEPLHSIVPRTRMEFFQDDLYPDTRDTRTPVYSADEWFGGSTKQPKTISINPGMQPLSQAPVEAAVKKYDFKTELKKADSEFSKDKFLASYYSNMTGSHGENTATVLKQDLMEGATEEEWND